MRTRTKLLLLTLVLAAVALACPTSPACPIHDGATGYFTGYRYVDGVQLGVYHSYRGHDFLVRCN
jgi:hypothetical protein